MRHEVWESQDIGAGRTRWTLIEVGDDDPPTDPARPSALAPYAGLLVGDVVRLPLSGELAQQLRRLWRVAAFEGDSPRGLMALLVPISPPRPPDTCSARFLADELELLEPVDGDYARAFRRAQVER